VEVTTSIGGGLRHVYVSMLGTPEAAEATDEIRAFLRKRIASA
jgi:hypothetical protein